eukprot:672299-Prymnesium_polylepis.3
MPFSLSESDVVAAHSASKSRGTCGGTKGGVTASRSVKFRLARKRRQRTWGATRAAKAGSVQRASSTKRPPSSRRATVPSRL